MLNKTVNLNLRLFLLSLHTHTHTDKPLHILLNVCSSPYLNTELH